MSLISTHGRAGPSSLVSSEALEPTAGSVLVNRVGCTVEPGGGGRPLKLWLESAMLLNRVHLHLVFQLVSLLLLDRLRLRQLCQSLLMRDLLVATVIRSFGPLCNRWLETAVLHMLKLDLLDHFPRLSRHRWRLAGGAPGRVVLLEVVGHSGGV